jgi:hypothetical protein
VRLRPAWWPDDFTTEQLGAEVVGKDYETAMYTIFAAGCDCVVRQVDRETWPAPDGDDPCRIQLYVTKKRVVQAVVG